MKLNLSGKSFWNTFDKELLYLILGILMFISLYLQQCLTEANLTRAINNTEIRLMNEQLNTQDMLSTISNLNRVEIDAILGLMDRPDTSLAMFVYEAGLHYDIDPLLLTVLINSESGFKQDVKHSLSYVKGLGGINEAVWKDLPNKTSKEQIFASAHVLRAYLDKYDGDIIKALTGYKGVSERGKRQAQLVYDNYKSVR